MCQIASRGKSHLLQKPEKEKICLLSFPSSFLTLFWASGWVDAAAISAREGKGKGGSVGNNRL